MPGTGVQRLAGERSTMRPRILNTISPARSATSRLFTGSTHGRAASIDSAAVRASSIGQSASSVVSCPNMPVHCIDSATPSAGSPSTTGPRGVLPHCNSTLPSPRMSSVSYRQSTGVPSLSRASSAKCSTNTSVSSHMPWVMAQATSALWPKCGKPGTPGKPMPITSNASQRRWHWWYTFGNSMPRCGSPASNGLPLAVRSPLSAHELDAPSESIAAANAAMSAALASRTRPASASRSGRGASPGTIAVSASMSPTVAITASGPAWARMRPRHSLRVSVPMKMCRSL